MPKLVQSRERWQGFIDAFMKHGANFDAVAAEIGCTWRTARRAWESGWPRASGFSAPPLKTLESIVQRAKRAVAVDALMLGEEAQAANERADRSRDEAARLLDAAVAKMQEVETRAAEILKAADDTAKAKLEQTELEAKRRLAELLRQAKVDAAETLADEANAAKFGRKAAIGAAAIAAMVMKDAAEMARQLKTAMGDLSKLKPAEAVRLIHHLSRLTESAEKAVILSLQAERLRVGQPTEILGVTGIDASDEERRIKAEAVVKSMQRRQARLQLVKESTGVGSVAPASVGVASGPTGAAVH